MDFNPAEDRLVLVGSSPELGAWDVRQGLPLMLEGKAQKPRAKKCARSKAKTTTQNSTKSTPKIIQKTAQTMIQKQTPKKVDFKGL